MTIILILQEVYGSLKEIDEIATNANVCNANSSSFKYKSSLIGNVEANGADGRKEKVNIAVPLKYLNNF